MDAHPQPADQPAPYVARTPEDLLATVPVVLGFQPEDSVVMLTFRAPRCFHARVDVPTEPEGVMPMIDSLLEPARRHGVGAVALVGFHADRPRTADALRLLAGALRRHGIDVLACLHAHAGRWWWVGRTAAEDDHGDGRPYDAAAHPFRARSVLEGRVTHDDRAALAAPLAPAPGGVAAGVLAGLVEPVEITTRRFRELLEARCGTGARLADDEVVEHDSVADAELLARELGARVIEEINHT